MSVYYRIDDIRPNMNWDMLNKFLDMLAEFGIKPLLGVIPDCKDEKLNVYHIREDYEHFIKKCVKDGYPIAMHGYDHVYISQEAGLFPINEYSEFAGVSREIQSEKIRNGKEILEKIGIKTDIFMAPAHSFDGITLELLEENGFGMLTDGYAKRPYKINGITFRPICNNIHRIIPLSKRWEEVTVVVHVDKLSDEMIERYRYINNRISDKLKTFDMKGVADIINKKYKGEYYREILVDKIYDVLAKIKHLLKEKLDNAREKLYKK